MKYTFVDDAGHKRTVNIPQEYITLNTHALGITEQEAIDMWLSDEGYIVNPVVQELTEKAKQNGVGSAGVASRPKNTRRQVARKPDYEKRWLIKYAAEALEDVVDNEPAYWNGDEKIELPHLDNIEITNPERIISFTLGENDYSFTLTKHRKKK